LALIEQVMIFALGFLVSGLLALLFLPAFWRRALRLSRRRLEMQLPLSMDEIIAERDQIRAEGAVELRRVEQRVEALVEDRARDMSEIGRRAGIIAELEAELARTRSENADIAARLASRETELLAAQAEIGALNQETFDLARRLDQRTGEVEADAARATQLQGELDGGRLSLAALETRAALLDIQGDDLNRQLRQAQLDLAEQTEQTQKAIDECAFLRRELQDAFTRREQAIAALEEYRTQAPRPAGEPGADGLAPADAELLRDAISDIGSQVSRLVGALEGQPAEARSGEPIGDRVRALQAKAERQVAAG
jgi:chromosome segregation ATPase